MKVCFLEAVLRDQRDGVIGDLPIAKDEINKRRYAEIGTITPLAIVDLRDDRSAVMGVPTDVTRPASKPWRALGPWPSMTIRRDPKQWRWSRDPCQRAAWAARVGNRRRTFRNPLRR